ncbi:NAD(P)H-dependent oxidoreductase [Cognatishimia sp. SS12]|uniref:NADPH-dependent FMN reductase n=1 Tax=Cognatishimia sp. SS12 TaxID=2979465 RepID=UPI00232E735B|nr:NAD(P)H-dependent oxidoreductase [Cognatishimia sp. SS12]MDC0738007.1 NAD(P)H-dependent oxidoreductase [Cognatishimia sp. SS12]
MAHKLLGLSGSLRADSSNTKLLREAARLYGDAAYTEANLNIPLYNGDDEEASGLPGPAQTLVRQIADADAILISTPEYNSAITGVLKNALDWVSRSKPQPWEGKPVAVMSAAAGRAGGIRAQSMLRSCMTPFKVRLAPAAELAVADSRNQFDAEGRLTNDRYEAALTRLMEALKDEVARGH